MKSLNGRRWWGAIGTLGDRGRRRPRVYAGRCSHGTATQIRFDGFGRYAYLVRRDRLSTWRPWRNRIPGAYR